MATRGAQGALTGFDYQIWFIVSKLVDVYFDESIKVKPEARIIRETKEDGEEFVIDEEVKKAIIDDVIVYERGSIIFYNIKYIAPSLDKWKVSDLDNQGVLKQIVEQFSEGYEGQIVFVSQSSCYLFQKVFDDIRTSKTVKELKLRLGDNKKSKLWKEWNDFKVRSKLSDKEILELARIVKWEQGYSIANYKKIIYSRFKGKFTNEKSVANSLYQLVLDASINDKEIDKESIINWLKKDKIFDKSYLTPSKIIKQLKAVSSSIINWKNTFGRISDSHIERNETQKILTWIDKPNNTEDRILLIVGDAGTGKTVIIKDVLKKLQSKNVATTALKSDLYSVKSVNELNEKLNITESFEKLITTLAEKRKTVLLIDQIDALSQTLSSDRAAIEFYYNLISRLSLVPNLKIIVSCRTYDLSFDPILQQLDIKEKVNVGNLSKEQIEFVLNKLDLKIESLPTKLIDILGNTQNLNIFCSIYDKELKLDELKTLQDLYEKMWSKKIIQHQTENNNLIEVLTEISDKMYKTQKIYVSKNYYEDHYSKQLQYLISEGILVLSDKNRFIQFFHQSFFDYCFARTFANSNKSLYQHITNKHQGLFVRSLIKQVISYLRGVNESEYLLQLERFLKSKGIRFHIKLMLINQLGFEEEPIDGEWQVVKKHILKNSLLTRQFLESIRSSKWFDRLEKQGLVKKYIIGKNKKLAHSCTIMLYNMIEIDPKPILKFILNISEFENKSKIISNLLFRLKDWSSPDSISLFEIIKDKYKGDYEFRFSYMLKNAMDYHLEWTINILNEYIKKKVQKFVKKDELNRPKLFEYELERVFEKLYKKYPELYCKMVFPLIKELAYKTKFDSNTNFFIDIAFHSYGTFELHYSHWKLYDWLKEYIQNLARSDKTKFLILVQQSKNEYSISILNLIVFGLLVNPKVYKNEIHTLLLRKNFLKDFRLDVLMSYNVNEAIEKTYLYLTKNQKEKLNKAILLSEPKKLSKEENRHWKGSKVYGLLDSIPNDERATFPDVQKKYLELKRKFGKLEKEKPTKNSVSTVGPPLPQIAYDKMTFAQWLESFKEYDETTSWDTKFYNKRGFHFGGLVEHSRMFGAKVKENPDKFYPFIMKIVNENIESNYLSEALSGLVEANYAPKKVSLLIKQLQKKEGAIRSSIIRGIEYLARQNYADEEIINIICDYAINDLDPQIETWQVEASPGTPYYGGDPLTAGINTIRGSAAFALVKFRNIHPYKEKIFDTLEQIAKDKSIGVKCAAIANLNVLIHLDEERVFKIFLKLTKDLNKEILRNGLSTLSYYIKRKYSILHKHIKQALKISGNHGHQSVQYFMGQLLMYLYVNGVRGSKDLLERALKNSDEVKAGALHYSIPNLTASKSPIKKKARNIFKELLYSKNQTIQNEYWRAFKEFKISDFNDLYNLIYKYSQVKGHRGRDNDSLYSYLLLCVNDEPEKCINILENMVNNGSRNDDEFVMNEKPVKLLIGAYNKLNEYNIVTRYANKAMDVFDKMLKDSSFKYDAYKVLQATDYS